MEICRICLRKSSSLAPLFKEKHGVGDRINEIFNFDFQVKCYFSPQISKLNEIFPKFHITDPFRHISHIPPSDLLRLFV